LKLNTPIPEGKTVMADLTREELVNGLEALRQYVDELKRLEAERQQAKGMKSESVFLSLTEEGILCI
jgi:uncharacterized protein (UPF0335 family)